MTSQPDSPATDRIGSDEGAVEAEQAPESDYGIAGASLAGATSDVLDSQEARDPDLIIVAGEVDEYATTGGSPDMAGAEATGTPVLTVRPQPDANVADDPQNVTGPSNSRSVQDELRPADLGRQWHDIQAMFVDDPRGSVDRAAAAADAAVSALVETLQQRQSELASVGSTSADSEGTEQLREALRSYRIFCQSLTEIGQRLARPATMTW